MRLPAGPVPGSRRARLLVALGFGCLLVGSPGTATAATGVAHTSAPAAVGAPANQRAPSIAGAALVGQRLAEAHGLWTNDPTSYAYQWLRCLADSSSCTSITSAVGSTYVVSAGDVGFAIRVQESAANAVGTGSPAVSAATAVVPPPPPPVSVTILSISGPRMAVRVTCAGEDGQLCTGQLTLTTQERTHGRTVVAVTARQQRTSPRSRWGTPASRCRPSGTLACR